jgi:hypothetical protein
LPIGGHSNYKPKTITNGNTAATTPVSRISYLSCPRSSDIQYGIAHAQISEVLAKLWLNEIAEKI